MENGQDDLVWTHMTEGKGTLSVKISDHLNQTGIYKIHVYNGTSTKFLCGTTCQVSSDTSSSFEIATIKKNAKYQAIIAFADMPSEVVKVKFPTWSDVNGQDDLKWVEATQTSVGEWKTDINITDFRNPGKYIVHAYAQLENGTLVALGKNSFDVENPTASVSITEFDKNSGSFFVRIKPDDLNNVSRIQVPVWSNANGQDDIKWYNAVLQQDGTYQVEVNVSNHNYATGLYIIHTYLTATNGITACVNTTSREVTMSQSIVKATDVNDQETSYELQATNVGMLGNISGVRFAVWSKVDGQDDLVWYNAERSLSTGTWNSIAQITNHKSVGEYNVHAYAVLSNGTMKFIGNTSFEVSKPSAQISMEKFDENEGCFTVIVRGENIPSGIEVVRVPVWSNSNGQDDVKWYDAMLQKDGTYQIKVSISNHNYETGIYIAHAYVYTKNGLAIFAGAQSVEVTLPKSVVQVTDTNGAETSYEMQATNVGTLGKVTNVQFAVWSDVNGQDDLVWYSANQSQATGTWKAVAQVVKHQSIGTYLVHAYATLSNGTMKFIGNASFGVSKPTAQISVGSFNENEGSFTVTVRGEDIPSGIESVKVPVWSNSNGQDDIRWYDAGRQSDGTYQTKVSISNHNYETGIYMIHTYVYTKNGLSFFAGAQTIEATMPKSVIQASDINGKETSFALQATNVGLLGAVSSLRFAVWSVPGGQDDIVWYNGIQNTATGTWNATAQITNHRTIGEYCVHVYAKLANGSEKFVGNTTFNVAQAPTATVTIENRNTDSGSFDIIISNVKSVSGVNKIQVPVWSRADQGDIIWYTASKQSNNTYKVSVDPINHNYDSGVYIAHVYLTAGNGIVVIAGMTSQVVQATRLYSIMGATQTSVTQMATYYRAKAPIDYPSQALAVGGAPTLEDFCQIFIEEANAEGVRAEVAFCQSMLETGYLKYGGIVNINQFNFAGIGALDGNGNGNCASFGSVREGVRAQIQHLKAYASKEELNNPKVDPRFQYVTRGCAPYVEWLGIHENPSGKGWATGANYGNNIVNLYIAALKRY